MKKEMLYKPDGRIYEVFDITYDNSGFPLFLIYRDRQWVRLSAKNFTPNWHQCFDGGYAEDRRY